MIECPECGYGWDEEEWEEDQAIRESIELTNQFFGHFHPMPHCSHCGQRYETHILTAKRIRDAEQTGKTVEKRVR